MSDSTHALTRMHVCLNIAIQTWALPRYMHCAQMSCYGKLRLCSELAMAVGSGESAYDILQLALASIDLSRIHLMTWKTFL